MTGAEQLIPSRGGDRSSHLVPRENCPACGEVAFRTLYSCRFADPPISSYLEDFYAWQGGIDLRYLGATEFLLDECSSCGLVFQRHIPGDALMVKLYDKWIDPEQALEIHRAEQDIFHRALCAQEVLVLITYSSKAPTAVKCLDFGMGWGDWLLMAQAFGVDVYGVELAPSRIAHAERHGIKVLAWDEIPRHRFDFIRLEEVLEHLASPLETMRHLAAALAPNGLIKVAVPNGGDIKRRLRTGNWAAPKGSRDSLNAISPLEHINCFSRAALVQMAEEAELETVNLPLRLQYAYSTSWTSPLRIAKNLGRPLWKNLAQRGTLMFFRRAGGRAGGRRNRGRHE